MFSKFFPDGGCIRFFGTDFVLAFSVVAEGGCFQYGRCTDLGEAGFEVFEGVDDGEGGAGDTVVSEEVFLPLAILADVKYFRPRMEGDVFGECLSGFARHVFEFVCDDVG